MLHARPKSYNNENPNRLYRESFAVGRKLFRKIIKDKKIGRNIEKTNYF